MPSAPGFSGVYRSACRRVLERFGISAESALALGELLRDAGAGQLYIVEGVFDAESYPEWGYEDVANDLNASLIDLNVPDPYADFTSVPVGESWYTYDAYTVPHPERG